MRSPTLHVSYRKGRAVAAYYYLPRNDDDQSRRTERVEGGLLIDFGAEGRPIGIEITAPAQFRLETLNGVLTRLGPSPADPAEFAPLVAA